MTNPYSLDPATGQSIGTSSDWTYQSTSPTPLSSTSFPVTPTSSDGDPFCTQEFCDYEDIYRTRFFRVTTSGGFAGVITNPNRDGTASVRDADGTVYATHLWTGPSGTGLRDCLGPVVTRISPPEPDIEIVWTKQYKCADGLLLRDSANLRFDIYNNLWLVYSTNSANGTLTTPGATEGPYTSYKLNIHFLRISKNTGNILYSKSFITNVIGSGYFIPSFSELLHDFNGNWYIGGTHAIGDNTWTAGVNNLPLQTAWLVKLNYNLDVQWGARWTGAQYSSGTIPRIRLRDTGCFIIASTLTDNYVYACGHASISTFERTPTYVKLDINTGAFVFASKDFAQNAALNSTQFSLNDIQPRAIASDSLSNTYIVYAGADARVVNGDRLGTIVVIKYNAYDSVVWQKDFFIDNIFGAGQNLVTFLNALTTFTICITVGDRIFVTADKTNTANDFAGVVYSYVLELTTAGTVMSTRRYRNSGASFNWLLQTASYPDSPGTLFLKFYSGDHVDTTQEVELFSVTTTGEESGTRTMISIPNSPSLELTTRSLGSVSYVCIAPQLLEPNLNTWAAVRTEFPTYSTSFTATAPDRPTGLFDVGQVRD